MAEYKQYSRKGLSEMTPYVEGMDLTEVSISKEDVNAGSPRIGDMIARNPMNHADKWLVSEQYFNDNLEEAVIPRSKSTNFEQHMRKLNVGISICRESWKYILGVSPVFIYAQVNTNVELRYINNMTSVPKDAKIHIIENAAAINHKAMKPNDTALAFRGGYIMVYNDMTAIPWTPSNEDMIATDWITYKSGI